MALEHVFLRWCRKEKTRLVCAISRFYSDHKAVIFGWCRKLGREEEKYWRITESYQRSSDVGHERPSHLVFPGECILQQLHSQFQEVWRTRECPQGLQLSRKIFQLPVSRFIRQSGECRIPHGKLPGRSSRLQNSNSDRPNYRMWGVNKKNIEQNVVYENQFPESSNRVII